ncbi:AbrB/MazE/SpoVT family DNA-binding domain-containing protein [candidate division WOR-3 bacterium]|nr:AbrB/MazE/SpoVT family DNA-binding domain-containing protein [candidate division WOR-3 bacterium]
MINKIGLWGHSLAVRIPKGIAEELNMKNEDTVELKKKGNAIEIQVVKNELILKKIIELINNDNIHSAIDTGENVGKEIW